LCEVLGVPQLASDERFRTNAARVRNQAMLQPVLEQAFVGKNRAECLTRLAEAGVPVGPINTIPEALAEPQVQHREMMRAYDHPAAESVSLVMSPFRFAGRAINSERPPPTLGQHTGEVLAECDIEPDKLAGLRERGVV
jgi:crotonobetainyl-CoA:carnitine CoA-transferase CaiB-like acyl-CoA transferase